MTEATILVQTIEKYPCLYNHSLQEYSRKEVTEKAWSEVAKIMKWSVEDCKEKWKNVRNGFVRSLKPGPSGTSAKHKKPYYLHDIMQFIVPYVRPITHTKNTGNLPFLPDDNEEEHQLTEEDEQTQTGQLDDTVGMKEQPVNQEREENRPQQDRKRKLKARGEEVDGFLLDYLKQKTRNTEDHRRMFLLSLLPDVNSLTDAQMRSFKIKVLVLLEDIMNTSQDNHVDALPIMPPTLITSPEILEDISSISKAPPSSK